MKPIVSTKRLRAALWGNALFSSLSGGLMILLPKTVAQWLGVETTWPLIAIGAGLLLFAADLAYQATRPRLLTWRALGATAGDALWVLGTVILLAFFREAFSTQGAVLLVAVALAVSGFALWQWSGIRKAHEIDGAPWLRHCLLVSVDAPADALWRVIGDMGRIQDFMPMLRRSAMRDGHKPQVGAVRECKDHSGKRWAEECVGFKDGRRFAVRFMTEEPGFPFPARAMLGGWEVVPEGSRRAQVKVWWDLEPKPAALAPLLMAMLAFGADRMIPQAIRRMAAAAKGDTVALSSGSKTSRLARLISKPC